MAQSFDHRAGEYRTRRRLVRTITRQKFSLSHDPRFHVIHGVELILGYPFERCKTMQSDDQNDGSPVNDQNNCSLVMNNTIQYDQIPSLTLIQKDTKLWSERWFFCERSEWCFFVNNQNDDSIVKHQNNGSIVNNQIDGSIVNESYIVNHQRLLSCYTIWTDSPTVMIQTGNSLGSCIHRYYPLYGERWLYCEPSEGWFYCERSLVKRYGCDDWNRQLPWYLHSSLLSLIWQAIWLDSPGNSTLSSSKFWPKQGDFVDKTILYSRQLLFSISCAEFEEKDFLHWRTVPGFHSAAVLPESETMMKILLMMYHN